MAASLSLAVDSRSGEPARVVLRRAALQELAAVEVLLVRPAPLGSRGEELAEGADARVQLVERVHRHGLERDGLLGAAVLEAAVVRDDEVRDAPLQLAREPLDARRFLADELAGEHEVADQLALVGVVESWLGGYLARLAEVVQQAAGSDQVAVELRVVIADAPAELHHAQGVLAQAAHEGVMDALRRRGAAEGRRQLRIVEERFEQRADVAVA